RLPVAPVRGSSRSARVLSVAHHSAVAAPLENGGAPAALAVPALDLGFLRGCLDCCVICHGFRVHRRRGGYQHRRYQENGNTSGEFKTGGAA
ncbi:MAG TPA: hypothetical protein VGR27_01570, partial [Longimicrobiaceae bacterium]|nr:hypothetical protein [Longimicrobiaceae bacterium]